MASGWNSLVEKVTGNKPLQCVTKIFIDGPEYFNHLANEIKSIDANEGYYFIYIMGWMLDVNFKLNNANDTLLNLLREADSKGTEIRVLISENPIYYKANREAVKQINSISEDAFAIIDSHCYTSPKSEWAIKALIKKARPILRILEKANLEKFIPELKGTIPIKELENFSNAGVHHDKVIIVKGPKGLVAYCGGMDINSNRISTQHDVQCVVENPTSAELTRRFVRRWDELKKGIPRNKKFNSVSLRGRNYPIISSTKKITAPYVSSLGTYNTPRSKGNKIGQKDRSAEMMIVAAINNANNYVYIEDQYMTSLTIAKTLHNALSRGLKKVIILTQSSIHSKPDILFPNRKRNDFIDTMLYGKVINKQVISGRSKPRSPYNKKVKIYQMAISPGKSWHEIVHSKLYIIDDEVLIIGSFNCSDRSMKHDSESGVIIIDATKDKKPSFVANFRMSLWLHHWRRTHPYLDLKILDMLNPFLWDQLTPTIDNYAPSGEDIDITLNKLLYEAGMKLYELDNVVSLSLLDAVMGNSGNTRTALQKEIFTLSGLVNTKNFRDIIWDIVDPHD